MSCEYKMGYQGLDYQPISKSMKPAQELDASPKAEGLIEEGGNLGKMDRWNWSVKLLPKR